VVVGCVYTLIVIIKSQNKVVEVRGELQRMYQCLIILLFLFSDILYIFLLVFHFSVALLLSLYTPEKKTVAIVCTRGGGKERPGISGSCL
jgi:arginine exporter protein ArgO